MPRLTKKHLKVLDKAELRRIAMAGMGMAMRDAYSLDEDGLLDWVHKYPEEFSQANMADISKGKTESLFRDGIFEYCVALQDYQAGKRKAPAWPLEDDPVDEIQVPNDDPVYDDDVQSAVVKLEAELGEPVIGPTSEEIEALETAAEELAKGNLGPAKEVLKEAPATEPKPKVKKPTKKRTNGELLLSVEELLGRINERQELMENALLFLANAQLHPTNGITNLVELNSYLI